MSPKQELETEYVFWTPKYSWNNFKMVLCMPQRVHKCTASENWKQLIISVLKQISVFIHRVIMTSNVLAIARGGKIPLFFACFSWFSLLLTSFCTIYSQFPWFQCNRYLRQACHSIHKIIWETKQYSSFCTFRIWSETLNSFTGILRDVKKHNH